TIRVFEAAQNLLLLMVETLGRKDDLAFGVRLSTDIVEQRAQLRIPGAARLAISQVFGGWRVKCVSATIREVAVDEMIVVQVLRSSHHDFAPRSARSFRAARHRC